MTWDEFKAAVDADLKRQGLDGSAALSAILWRWSETPCIERHDIGRYTQECFRVVGQ